MGCSGYGLPYLCNVFCLKPLLMINTPSKNNVCHSHPFLDTDSSESLVPSYLASWALLVAQAIDSYGCSSADVFLQAGADLDKLKKHDARLPCHIMQRVWDVAVAHTQDPDLAIRVAQYFKPTAYSALGMTMVASRNVYDALKRASRYACFIGNAHHSYLEESKTEVAFVLRSRTDLKPLTNVHGMSATLCCLYKVLQEVAAGDLSVKEVHFEQSLPCGDALKTFFSCPVYFASDCNKLVFEKSDLFSVQPFAQSQLASSLDDWLEEYLYKNQKNRISTRVQKILLKNILDGEIDLTMVASSLAMSIRVLQRKLQGEGTVYSELLDGCRKKLSIQLILDNQHQLSEVSSMLGFSDQSNFTRAFRRWTGTTPLQYRG